MIKINLLPVREAKKKETNLQQIAIAVLVVVFASTIFAVAYLVRIYQIRDTKQDITTANTKITELKVKIGKLEALKTLKADVKKKLDVLTDLRKKKVGPAQRLATISTSTPDQLWLTGYSESGDTVKIAGLAYNEELIAKFMRNLEDSAEYMKVELVVSEQKEIVKLKLKRFELTCKLEFAAPISSVATNNAVTQQPQSANQKSVSPEVPKK
jgi:type IV pilus assembly protein PilN